MTMLSAGNCAHMAARITRAGGNAGLFWRVAEGEHLFGGNLFADYEEDDEDGGFGAGRWGRNGNRAMAELSANHYRALTDGKLRQR